jgi:ribulose-5-phosphate 4-epimerase/fuculose-1-phosphate aldolase
MTSSSAAGRKLAKLGERFGHHLTLVQAAGGNISLKRSSSRLTIKASGIRLKEMTPTLGWSEADFPVIRKNLPRISKRTSYKSRELAYANLLQTATRTPGRRVSMEAGFHAILSGQYVIHLHSVAGILLGMLPTDLARRYIRETCQSDVDVRFVEAALPGHELTAQMMESLKSTSGNPVQLWIQRNHGVVWSGNSRATLVQQIDHFELKMKKYFEITKYPAPHVQGSAACSRKADSSEPGRLCFCRWPKCYLSLQPLFPDFVIYFNVWSTANPDLVIQSARTASIDASSPLQWKDKAEVFYAHALVATLSRSLGCYHPLPKKMIGRLKSMELERLRKTEILKA